MSKISEKCGEILTVKKNFKNILNCKKFKKLKMYRKI